MLDARHACDGQRFIQPENTFDSAVDRTGSRGGPDPECLPLGSTVDAVVQHVVVAQRIIAVETPARRQLRNRWIQRGVRRSFLGNTVTSSACAEERVRVASASNSVYRLQRESRPTAAAGATLLN